MYYLIITFYNDYYDHLLTIFYCDLDDSLYVEIY